MKFFLGLLVGILLSCFVVWQKPWDDGNFNAWEKRLKDQTIVLIGHCDQEERVLKFGGEGFIKATGGSNRHYMIVVADDKERVDFYTKRIEKAIGIMWGE